MNTIAGAHTSNLDLNIGLDATKGCSQSHTSDEGAVAGRGASWDQLKHSSSNKGH